MISSGAEPETSRLDRFESFDLYFADADAETAEEPAGGDERAAQAIRW